MKISEIITDKYKLRIPPTVYYELLADVQEVEEQEPKTGHWVLVQRGKYVDVKCSECENVRVKEYAYNYTVEQVLADKENITELLAEGDMQHCPYCGVRMVEPQKSEDT